MGFTSQDIAVIEQALQIAIRSQSDASKSAAYQEVLGKLRANASSAMSSSHLAFQDGYRFDYDDSTDLG
ncbi:hypothetical protein SAMN02799630_00239 [Paenibacillus sp. UNCCL117]|uniref:hypothetical protein n=1 Tax=unclassified Paenibacillus TaxID=185978 RepID=UPI0008898C34|nr:MULTISPECIES: hypothetical protein [unclassified Paenibacillus]SDC47179.1 hypothetical protein SAMN04488602_102293 [Paenibacillus sp. cl123]SFW12181.1 hypothetical protein SAMN02799630_00239 [Paenibacillus sp. UNCCL117]